METVYSLLPLSKNSLILRNDFCWGMEIKLFSHLTQMMENPKLGYFPVVTLLDDFTDYMFRIDCTAWCCFFTESEVNWFISRGNLVPRTETVWRSPGDPQVWTPSRLVTSNLDLSVSFSAALEWVQGAHCTEGGAGDLRKRDRKRVGWVRRLNCLSACDFGKSPSLSLAFSSGKSLLHQVAKRPPVEVLRLRMRCEP